MRAMHLHLVQYDIWHLTRGRAFVQTYSSEANLHLAFEMGANWTLVIPPRTAHGFLALEDLTLTYFLTREYDGSDEFEFNAYGDGFPGVDSWPLPASAVLRSRRDEISASLTDSLEAKLW
jgi:dTDP-4-dehydrorhamnose 3,5-epimerase-like enzyme